MEKLPRQVYTREFRERAVELVMRESLSIAEAARCLSLSPKTLTTWVSEYIDLFSNRQRRQARLGYLSPAACSRDSRERRERHAWRPLLTTHLS